LDQPLLLRLLERHQLLALRPAAGVDGRERHVVEALRLARPEVEDARQLGMVEEVQVDSAHVLDRDEIALLLAVGISARPDDGPQGRTLPCAWYWLKKCEATEAMRPLCHSFGP